jgi:hypothetical protein
MHFFKPYQNVGSYSVAIMSNATLIQNKHQM